MKRTFSLLLDFVEANVHTHVDVYHLKGFAKIPNKIEYTAISLDIIIFLAHAG